MKFRVSEALISMRFKYSAITFTRIISSKATIVIVNTEILFPNPNNKAPLIENVISFLENEITIIKNVASVIGNAIAVIEMIRSAIATHNTLVSKIDESRRNVTALEKELADLSAQMLSGVATKYGKSSNEYRKAGGSLHKSKATAS